MNMTIETVEQVVALLTEYPVSEITLEQDGAKVCVRRSAGTPASGVGHAPPPAALSVPDAMESSAETAVASAMAEDEISILGAPMVGLFHHLDSPVRYGGSVASGQLVGHIESMKLMNDVLAEDGGRVLEVLVEDGAAVEYGQPLFRFGPQGE